MGPKRIRSFFHAPTELAAARRVIERFIARYDLERDPRYVFEAWLELRKHGLQATDTMLHYLDQVANQSVRPESDEANKANESQVLEVLTAWRALFGDRPCSAKEAISQAVSLELPTAKRLHLALRKLFADTGQPLTPRCLASWLRLHQLRPVVGGFVVSSPAESGHVKLWRVTAKSV
jgi:hypothetical protein